MTQTRKYTDLIHISLTITSVGKTFLRDFIVILKRTLQNYDHFLESQIILFQLIKLQNNRGRS